MSFTSKKLHSQRSGIGYIKGATLFFLGMSCVLFMARAFDISPTATNAVQYIQRIFLTQNGDSNSPTQITLDGTNGNGTFAGSVGADIVTATTLSGTNIKSTTITGSTICLANDTSSDKCRTSWPTGAVASAGGGESIWSTGTTANRIYYALGNVGIGLQNPLYPLQVSGTIFANTLSGNQICLGGVCQTAWPTGGTIIGGDSVRYSGTNKIYYTSGNVGIGTNSPTANLHIRGAAATGVKLLLDSNIEIPQILEFLNENVVSTITNGLYDFSLFSSSPIIFGVASTEKMRILANGNVGIGTATPSAKLHVAGSGIFDGNVGIGTTGPTAKLEVKDLLGNITVSPNRDWLSSTININAYSAGSSGLEIGHGYFGGGFGFIKSNEPFLVYISKLNIPDFSISTGGNVGIGTANNPRGYKLSVEAATGKKGILSSGSIAIYNGTDAIPDFEIYGRYGLKLGALGIESGKGTYVWGQDGGSLQYSGGTALMWNTSGNVGIGTASPTAKLQVNGAIKISDDPTSIGPATNGGSCVGQAGTLIYRHNRLWGCSGSPEVWVAL